MMLAMLLFQCNQSQAASNLEPIDYNKETLAILINQQRFAQKFERASTSEKNNIIEEARKYVLEAITTKLMPAWLGTPWDFNGTTQVPGEGKIACGYFVTTILRDAGFKVQRVKLAQQASLKIIQTICPKPEIRDYGNLKVPQLIEKLDQMPEGLYVVGLDMHTGFIYNKRKAVEFIHASYGNPRVVVREKAIESVVLAQSNRFVLGRVDNDFLLKKWLNAEEILLN